MSLYLETQPNQNEIQTSGLNSRSFFIDPNPKDQLFDLSGEIFENSRTLRSMQAVSFDIKAAEGTGCDLEMFKLTLAPHSEQKDAWSWQILMRGPSEKPTILDGTVSEYQAKWQHIEVDQQGSLWRKAYILDAEQRLAVFAVSSVLRSRPGLVFEQLTQSKLQIAEALESVKSVPRTPEFHKKCNEAENCLRALQLFSVGNRKTAYVQAFKEVQRPLDELPLALLAPLLRSDHEATLEYRPTDLSKISDLVVDLRGFASSA